MVDAAPIGKGYVPAFRVEKLEGVYTKSVARMDKDAKGIETQEVTENRGWLVTFPQRHGMLPNSIHITSEKELKRLGFDKTVIPVVDDDGEEVGQVPNRITTRKVKIDA